MNYALILIVVVLIMYKRTLNYGYCIDDFDVAKRSTGIKPKGTWEELYSSWQGIYYKQPRLGHRIVLLLQLANTLMVYYAFGHNWISFLVALLFTLHPAATQTSVWLSGKGYATAIFFILLMYSFKWLSPLFYWAAFTWGGFSAAFASGIFLTSTFWPMIFLVPVMFLIKRKRISGALGHKWSITPAVTKKPSLKRIILFFKSIGYYTCLTLFPTRLGVYHDYLYTYGLSEEETKQWHKPDLFALLGLGVMSVTGYCLVTSWASPVTLGLLWFVLFIAQWCNFPTTLQQAIAERYLSLPLIGAMYALVNIIYLIPDEAHFITWGVFLKPILLTAFVVGFAVRLHLHITSYRNIHYQIDHNLANFPDNYAIWTWKGQEEKNRGAFFTAIEAWFQGWKLRKTDFRLNNNIAVLLTQVGQIDQAMDFLKLAEENIPKDQMEAGLAYIRGARNDILEMKRKMDLEARKNKSQIIIPGGPR
jgi:tetratricopeptide (TPR) repeat protein